MLCLQYGWLQVANKTRSPRGANAANELKQYDRLRMYGQLQDNMVHDIPSHSKQPVVTLITNANGKRRRVINN